MGVVRRTALAAVLVFAAACGSADSGTGGGSSIIVVLADPTSSSSAVLVALDPDGGDLRQLAWVPPDNQGYPRGVWVSPDGAAIAMSRGWEAGVEVLDGISGELRWSGLEGRTIEGGSWSNGSDRVALRVADPDGADGSYSIVVTGREEESNRTVVGNGPWDTGGWWTTPTWSPDDELLAYGSPTRFVRVATGDPDDGPVISDDLVWLAWLPDEQHVLAGSEAGPVVAEVGGDDVTPLGRVSPVVVTPDGHWLISLDDETALGAEWPEHASLTAHPMDGAAPTVLLTDEHAFELMEEWPFANFAPSPSSGTIVASAGREIVMIPLDGGPIETVLELGSGDGFIESIWWVPQRVDGTPMDGPVVPAPSGTPTPTVPPGVEIPSETEAPAPERPPDVEIPSGTEAPAPEAPPGEEIPTEAETRAPAGSPVNSAPASGTMTLGAVLATIEAEANADPGLLEASLTVSVGPCGTGQASWEALDPATVVGRGSTMLCTVTLDAMPGDSSEMLLVVLDDEGTVARRSSTDGSTGWPFGAPAGELCEDYLSAWYGDGPYNQTEAYIDVLAYWFLEGMPDRMDVDGNGIPCEQLFPPEVVADVWSGVAA